MARDTDADWREIGSHEPFWGVLTHPQFRRENLNADRLAEFYASGRQFIAAVEAEFSRIAGAPFHVPAALDFGCGAGRLTEAMTLYAGRVVGYDISPGMLREANAHSAGQATYTNEFPQDSFDWINSYIVFQHMPPGQGFSLLEQLLAKLNPGGFVSLHFTIYRDAYLQPSAAGQWPHTWRSLPNLVRRPDMWRRAIRLFQKSEDWKLLFGLFRRKADTEPVGAIKMFDYDLGRLCEAFHRHGLARLVLVHENHAGNHGVIIFGRREDSAAGGGSPAPTA